jgi:hypothetical protein
MIASCNMKGLIMNFQAFVALTVAALGMAVFAAPGQAAEPAAGDGLVAVRNINLDEVYLRANADLASYRKIVIDPVQIAFRKDWNQSEQDYKGRVRRLLPDDVRAIEEGVTSGMQTSFAVGFKARGYDIVAAPGPGVLRLTPSLQDLYVNAAEETPSGQTRYLSVDAGEATLVLEARDATTGVLLARIVDHRSARENKASNVRDLRRTTNSLSYFWLDAMFRQWATTCAKQFEAARNT